MNGASGSTFTLTFDGQTTAPIAYNATGPDIDAALEALPNIEANEIQVSPLPTQTLANTVSTTNINVFFRRARAEEPAADDRSAARSCRAAAPSA